MIKVTRTRPSEQYARVVFNTSTTANKVRVSTKYLTKGHFHVDGQEKPQVEKRFYDAACQTKENRQGQQAQDESRARLPDTRDIRDRQRDPESFGPTV